MKNFFLSAAFLVFLAVPGFAQILEKVQWRTSISQQEARVGETVELVFTASIARDWYIYSSDFDPDLGPMLTSVKFEPNSSYELVGGLQPVEPLRKYDSLIWGGEYSYFKKQGIFKQKVKVTGQNFKVAGTIEGQVCSDIDGQCILFEHDFDMKKLEVLPAVESNTAATEPAETPEAAPAPENTVAEKEESPDSGENIAAATPEAKENTSGETSTEPTAGVGAENTPEVTPAPVPEVSSEVEGTDGTLGTFLIFSFLWGLAAIFTPCVFPMIPMTVSFFTNQKKKSQAVLYGFSIVFIYTLVGAVVAPLFGPAFANFLSTHWLPNVLFFIIFIVFALSFFGMFEIVLPSNIVNKVDKQADKGGVAGVFFMAFTLVLVSFSCTGPIVGSILVQSAGGAVLKPVLGMAAFGLAFGLPFALFALFPSWLQSLPKSGGWLNSVKVVLGFVELALAFKFLSIADQVYHWGILDRHVNIAIWIAIALAMGLYFLGAIRLPHDSKTDHVSVPRLLLAIASFAFVVYLVPGMFGAPLKELSGYLPPRTTSDFDLVAELRKSSAGRPVQTVSSEVGTVSGQPPKHSEFLEIPHGIKGYFDYEEGMEAARRTGKPVFIDFTGHGCVNCRKMEDNVWAEEPVLSTLKQDYIVIALYVDERRELPEDEWVTSTYDGKVKKTIGAVNADFQISKFQNNAQPFYLLLDHEGNLLVRPVSYEPDVERFHDFLQSGLQEFRQRQQKAAMK